MQIEFGDRYRTLGPVYSLPVVLELYGLHRFSQSVIDAFVEGDEKNDLRISIQSVLDHLNACISDNRVHAPTNIHSQCLWWESTFTRHMLLHFKDTNVENYQGNLTFSKLSYYGVRIKGFRNVIEVHVRRLMHNNIILSIYDCHRHSLYCHISVYAADAMSSEFV